MRSPESRVRIHGREKGLFSSTDVCQQELFGVSMLVQMIEAV